VQQQHNSNYSHAITSSSDWICWQISGNVWLVVTAGFKNFESSAPLEQCGKVFLLHPQEKWNDMLCVCRF